MICFRTGKSALRLVRSFKRDRSGVAMLEFAFALPLVLGISCYGLEIANVALLNMRVSQITLALADNASRVGVYASGTQQLREVDVDDIFAATKYQGSGINLTTNGRIILSSLENIQQSYDTATGPVQRIHWQRCLGAKSGTGYDSSYGTTTKTAGTTALVGDAGTTVASGMGNAGAQVTAPSGSGVMFVEVNYLTKPLFGSFLIGPTRIHYIASFIVRDGRDYKQLYNPGSGATQMTCDKYTT
jgi:Flp pilus assembly protein TadG